VVVVILDSGFGVGTISGREVYKGLAEFVYARRRILLGVISFWR